MGYKSNRNPYNCIFKQQVVASLYHDIYILPETHCLNDEIVELDNYIVYQNNRIPHANAIKGSGGIAIAVHSTVVECHTILSVYKGIDGQLAIKMKCKNTELTVGILGLYLSPDSYRYGQDPEGFYNEAAALWRDLSDCDLIVGAGDLNSRTSNMIDYIPEVDGQLIPKRINIDKNKNAHGDSFITFLKDNRCLILNGRVTPEYDNYTFVSTRGCSVPDYFFCPTENLFNCTEMKTILVSEVINNLGLEPPISIPDHSILSATFRMSFYEVGINYENMNVVKNDQNKYKTENSKALPQKSLKKNLSKINEQFFMSQEILQQVLNTISKLENIVDTKDELNKLWAEVKNIFLGEMSTLPTIPSSKLKKQNKKFRKSQPFWNSELEIMWKNSCSCEKAYLDFRVHSNQDFAIKNILRLNFKTAQKNFDKKFRYLKRQHHKNQFRDLETNASKNPTAMWEALKKLDNRPTTKAALEIIREDKSVSTDLKEVLNRWSQGFSLDCRRTQNLLSTRSFFKIYLKRKVSSRRCLLRSKKITVYLILMK